MATGVERNAMKAMNDASHKMAQLSADVANYVGDYRWNNKSQEDAATQWDNIEASMIELEHALHVLKNALNVAHDSVNGRFALTAASYHDDDDVVDI